MTVNLNKWAKDITLREGKEVSLPISQVKEVMKIMLLDIKKMELKDLVTLLARIKK